jgi:invasion protein IalB
VAAMLAELPVSIRRLTRSTYDRQRTPEAPSSSTLVNRYGSWVKVCRAAQALTDGGRGTNGTARAWAAPTCGRRRPPDYTARR